MTRIPKLITICSHCEREDVGVVLDWTHRDGNNRMIGRYRMARHKIIFKGKDPSIPWCPNGRIIVPDENVFEREEVVSGATSNV